MEKPNELRILHLPVNIAGNAFGLSLAERSLGYTSRCVAFEQHFTQMPADVILFGDGESVLKKELKKWRLFLASVRSFDVFHFNFGQKFFPWGVRPWKSGESSRERLKRLLYFLYSLLVGRLDLVVLKILGKKMFMTWQGDDARQGDFSEANYDIHFVRHVEAGYYDAYSDRRKRKLIALFDGYCAGMFALNPDLLNVLPKSTQFLPYSHVNLRDWVPTPHANPRIKIAHAPSHREVKGTQFLLTAVESLKRRGFDFDFVLVEGLANSEARKIYETADVLVDQLLAGWYGGLAVEFMALGKPVVCYLRPEDLQRVPADFVNDLPIVTATPTTIEAVLADLIENRSRILELGRKSRAFVERWHDPQKVAAHVVERYQHAMKPNPGFSLEN